MIKKYRIVIIEWQTVFGEVVKSPSVQLRIGFFFWHTLAKCESIAQCRVYVDNIKRRKDEKLVKFIEYK